MVFFIYFFFFVFCNFLGIPYSRLGKNSSERFFFFSLFLGHSQPILIWKEAIMVFFNFWNYFAIFLEFFIPGQVGTHIKDFFFFFFSFFLGLSTLILDRKVAIVVFFNFLNFFAIYLEFSIPGRVKTHRNNFFYFLSFSAISNLFWLEKKP